MVRLPPYGAAFPFSDARRATLLSICSLVGRWPEHRFAADDPDNLWVTVNCQSGSVSVVGDTTSPDFPVKAAAQTAFGGATDGFAARLNPAGMLVYASYLGGNGIDNLKGLAGDDILMAGTSYQFDDLEDSPFDRADMLWI